MKINNDEIIKQAKLELARREFFFYCIKKPLAKRVVQKSRKAMLRK